MKLKFSGRGLAFLHHFKANMDIRYYLNGVYLAPMPAEAGGGVIGAACDGHTLGMWHDKDGQIERAVIARITTPLVTACKKPDAYLTNLDGRLAVMAPYRQSGHAVKNAPDVELCVQPNGMKRTDGGPAWELLGNFPDISRVARNNRATPGLEYPREAMFLNSVYLARIGKAFPREKNFCGLIVQQNRPGDAVVFSSPETPEAFALMMPMHKHGEETEPVWLARWLAAVDRTQAASTAPRPAMPSDAVPPPEFRPVKIGGKKAGSYPA